ncbi:MAG: glycosyltransferase family 4 protein, partial [Arenicella sp.]|nr:glycosyltransferase family 4 protein [Arenicella sp.]
PYVARWELPGKLSEIDIFIVPSFQEGLCIAALEAMSCGVPVVSTRCGGPENYIVDGENGLLCDHNPTSVSKAVVQLLLDSEKRKQLGECARQTVVERFSVAAQTERFNLLMARQIANLGEAASMPGKD